MILDDCRNARDLLERVQNTTQNRGLVEALNIRIDELRLVNERLTEVASKLDVLRQKDAIPSDKLPDGQVAIDRAIRMKKTLAENPEDITTGRSFTDLKKSFAKLSDQIDDAAKESWSEYGNRYQPTLNQNQLKQARQTGHSETVTEIEELASEVKRSAKHPPIDKRGFADIEKLWNQIRDCVKQLPALSEDPEIQKFLDAAYNDGARLEQLTPAVEKWLREQKMLNQFCIVTG